MSDFRPMFLWVAAALALTASVSRAEAVAVPLAPSVDLPRFMGDWYVIALSCSHALDHFEGYRRRVGPAGRVLPPVDCRRRRHDLREAAVLSHDG